MTVALKGPKSTRTGRMSIRWDLLCLCGERWRDDDAGSREPRGGGWLAWVAALLDYPPRLSTADESGGLRARIVLIAR